MKVLLIRFSSLGDIVMTTPIIRAIEMQLNAEIHFILKKEFADVLKHNIHLSKLYLFEKHWKEHEQELISEDYDLIVDLHNNRRSFELKRRLRKPHSTIKKMYLRKWAYILLKINTFPSNHVIDRYFDDLDELQIKNDHRGMQVYMSEKDSDSGKEVVQRESEKGKPVVAIVVGAAHFTKTIPPQLLIDFIQTTDYSIILLGGPSDKDSATEIENNVDRPIVNLVGRTSILESAAVLKYVDLVIAADTGMMHIAASFSKPTVVLYGATAPPFGMYPYHIYQKKVTYLETDIWCRPCSSHGSSICPLGHFRCMNSHSITNIIDASNELLAASTKSSNPHRRSIF